MTIDGRMVSDRLSAALAGRLALQMSVSSLPVVEEWMDLPLSRWLDSVPLPPEMPDGEGPPLVVALGSDAAMVRWSAAGAPGGLVPKLVDYLRKAGALPGDFRQVDAIGQELEPAVVGSWIEARPGAVETGWMVADRMELARIGELLGEGAWLDDLGGGLCVRAGRSVGAGAGAVTDVVVELAGTERSAKLAAAAAVFARCGLALGDTPAARLGGEGGMWLGARARGGRVVSARLLLERPGAGAAREACRALGLDLAPAIAMVERSIGAAETMQLELEWSAAGPAVVVEYVAASARSDAN
ncbi:MAG TPA: hypothetical protein VEL05_05305 [Candidatus Acidoferrum sp.]|nr:hypothetical protein [Candidatus Acidoferrum sp.]